MLADTNRELTKALDLELDLSGPLGSMRCKRFSLVVEDGKVTQANVEPDGTGKLFLFFNFNLLTNSVLYNVISGMTCSLAAKLKI